MLYSFTCLLLLLLLYLMIIIIKNICEVTGYTEEGLWSETETSV